MSGSWGAQIVDSLKPGSDDIQIPKRRYSGFFQTDLDLYLREYNIEHVIITGIDYDSVIYKDINWAIYKKQDIQDVTVRKQ